MQKLAYSQIEQDLFSARPSSPAAGKNGNALLQVQASFFHGRRAGAFPNAPEATPLGVIAGNAQIQIRTPEYAQEDSLVCGAIGGAVV